MTREGTGLATDPTQLITSLFALIPVPVAIVDDGGRVVLSNSAFADVFQGIQNIQSIPHHEVEMPGRGTYELEVLPLNDQGLRIVYASEITNEVQLRRQVVHLEKMAAIGQLAAGVAHEINNPLTGVLGAAQLLLMDIPAGAPAHALVKDIEVQAQRIRKIIANLTRIAQREAGAELVPVDLNRVLDDALELVGPEELKKARIEVERTYAEPLPAVRGNPVQLQEAMIELLTNARRAMPDGGRLTVATTSPDARMVAVRVADTGRGIEKQHLSKIFDPFFTTKENWSSTGMGLTLVHKIVEEHRGTIVVDSETGRGATFTLTFPASTPRAHLE